MMKIVMAVITALSLAVSGALAAEPVRADLGLAMYNAENGDHVRLVTIGRTVGKTDDERRAERQIGAEIVERLIGKKENPIDREVELAFFFFGTNGADRSFRAVAVMADLSERTLDVTSVPLSIWGLHFNGEGEKMGAPQAGVSIKVPAGAIGVTWRVDNLPDGAQIPVCVLDRGAVYPDTSAQRGYWYNGTELKERRTGTHRQTSFLFGPKKS